MICGFDYEKSFYELERLIVLDQNVVSILYKHLTIVHGCGDFPNVHSKVEVRNRAFIV